MQQIIQMKIEQLVVQYLFKNKKVKLQHIGEFTFVSDSNESGEESTHLFFPEGSIHFRFDPKIEHDEQLIHYIMAQTGKIKPLAASDLESYSILGKQFLNIGKTLYFKDLGALQKNQNNEYSFIQGESIATKMEYASSSSSHSINDTSEKLISFASPVRKKSKIKWVAPLTLIILVIILIIVFFFPFFSNKKTPIQSVSIAKDSSIGLQHSVADSIQYKIIINEFNNKEAATKNIAELISKKPSVVFSIYTSDSVTFQTGFSILSLSSDTAKLMDSIRMEYGIKSYIKIP